MRRSLAIIAVLTILCAGNGYFYHRWSGAEAELDALRRERSTANYASACTVPSAVISTGDAATPPLQIETPKMLPTVEPRSQLRSAPIPPAATEWMTQEMLRTIEQFVVLEPGEKERVQKELHGKSPIDLETAEDRELLTEILGAEKANSLFERLDESRRKAQQERIESEAYRWSRKLQLNAQQEQAIRAVIAESNETRRATFQALRKKREEIMARHNDKDAARGSMQQAFQEMRAIGESLRAERSALYQERFRAILNDDQYNAFLAEDSQSDTRMP